jgi:hypothetical protein
MKTPFELLKPVLWYLGVTAVVVYGLHLNRQDGYDDGYAVGKAEGDVVVAQLRETFAQEKQDMAEAAASAAKQASASLIAEQAKGNQLASQLADTKDLLRKTTDTLTGEIVRVTSLYRPILGAQLEPLPVAVFTTGFVRVWNNASGVSTAMPTPNSASGTAASPSGTGAVDDLDSGLGQAQLLANHVRNAELHGICRAQLNHLIDWTLNESK